MWRVWITRLPLHDMSDPRMTSFEKMVIFNLISKIDFQIALYDNNGENCAN